MDCAQNELSKHNLNRSIQTAQQTGAVVAAMAAVLEGLKTLAGKIFYQNNDREI